MLIKLIEDRTMRNVLIAAAIVLTTAFSAQAADVTIDMLNKRDDGAKMVYSQDVARIDVGDTVTWVPTSKGHNVEIIAAPDGYDIPKKSKLILEIKLNIFLFLVLIYKSSFLFLFVFLNLDIL